MTTTVEHPADQRSPTTGPRWAFPLLIAAGIYNLVWGLTVVLFPSAVFQLFQLPLPRYPEIWQCVGMIVGVYGIGYLLAARAPMIHWPIILVGLLGKLFGPLGFAISYLSGSGTLPWQWIGVLLTNDLIWWIPFTVLLYHAFSYHADPKHRRQSVEAPSPPKRLPAEGMKSEGRKSPLPEEATRGELATILNRFPSSSGETLLELSEGRPCLVVFLRHFGCTFSREAAAQLALNRGAFEARDVRIAVVHMGSSDEGAQFLANYSLHDLPQISDPLCELYQAFGLRRGTWRQLFGLRVWLRGFIVAILQGYGVGAMRGDGFQLSGVFVLEEGQVLNSYRSQLASDLPNLLQFTSAALACAHPK
jgi:hypothetical protein